MHPLIEQLLAQGPVITDGAWGTELQGRGLSLGEFPDAWNLTHPDRVAEVARALEVHPSELHRWRRELQEHGGRAFRGAGNKRAEQSQVAELERKVGQQAMEIDFLKRALQHVEEQRLLRALNNGAPSTGRSRTR